MYTKIVTSFGKNIKTNLPDVFMQSRLSRPCQCKRVNEALTSDIEVHNPCTVTLNDCFTSLLVILLTNS